jgi:3-hydroxyisobutyrate dehydrogenase-like beta-hydroxyacid dehydrogenase
MRMRHTAATIGVIGLGNMGRPIAENLWKAGYSLAVHDVRRAAAADLKGRERVTVAATPAAVGVAARIVFTVLPSAHVVEEVVAGPAGLLRGMRRGGILVDMSTSEPEVTRRLAARLARRGIRMLDAPVSGGVLGARAGTLAVMVGGDRRAFRRVAPILGAVGRRVFYLGSSGSGHAMKLVHNLAANMAFFGACEAAVVGVKLGFPLKTIVEVFNAGNARGYHTEVKLARFVVPRAWNAGASLSIIHKDTRLGLALARRRAAPSRIARAMFGYVDRAHRKGWASRDYTRLIQYLMNDPRP